MNASHHASVPRFASALSVASNLDTAVEEIYQAVAARLQAPYELVICFFSTHFVDKADLLSERLSSRFACRHLLGCSGESIVGAGREIEGAPCVSVLVARLPGASVLPLELTFERTAAGGSVVGWPDQLMEEWPSGSMIVLLGDPFSFPADVLLDRLNADQPGTAVTGGLASGGFEPGQNRLLLEEKVLVEGAVGWLLWGPVRLRTLVSQGCRPIGRSFVVTKADRNVVHQLGGRPALSQLRELVDTLPNREKSLIQQLYLGRVVDEYRDHFEQGDFLVRNVLGVEPETEGIVVGDFFRAGQTVQFHIRDAETADAELRQMLAQLRQDPQFRPGGGLLFTCNGRGTRLFQQPHHDASLVQQYLGELPLSGFFAQGELGPIGSENFLHGFTASLALFEYTGT